MKLLSTSCTLLCFACLSCKKPVTNQSQQPDPAKAAVQQSAKSSAPQIFPNFKFGLSCKRESGGTYNVFAILGDGIQPDADPGDPMEALSQNDENISLAEFAYFDSSGQFYEPFSFRSHIIGDYNSVENQGNHTIYDFQWDVPYNLPYSLANTLGDTLSNHVVLSRTSLTLSLPPAASGEPTLGFEGDYSCTRLSDADTQQSWKSFRAVLATAQLQDAEKAKAADQAAQKQRQDSIKNKPI